jgi:branched-chain amino acid transport system substrate-binding protein
VWEKKKVATAIVFLGCLLASACSSASKSNVTAGSTAATTASAGQLNKADPSLSPIEIGWANVDTGTPSFPDATAGARAAVAYINAELGGVGRHPLKLVECSVGVADPESNQACGQQFGNDSTIKVVMTGFVFNSAPFYGALQPSGKVVFGRIPLTKTDFSASNAVFYGMGAIGAVAGLPRLLKLHPEVHTVGIFQDDTQGGADSTALLKPQLEAIGLKVNVTVVNSASGDFAAAVSSLANNNAVFVGLPPQGAIGIAKNESLLKPGTLILGTTASVNSAIWSQVPDKQKGWVFTTDELTADLGKGLDPNVDTFLAKYPLYSNGAKIGDSTVHIWSNMLMLKKVLETVGVNNLTPQSIASALRSYRGPVIGQVGDAHCGLLSDATSVCTHATRAFVAGDGKAAYFDSNILDVATP